MIALHCEHFAVKKNVKRLHHPDQRKTFAFNGGICHFSRQQFQTCVCDWVEFLLIHLYQYSSKAFSRRISPEYEVLR